MEFVTQQFGNVSYSPEQVIQFPQGLPAFEDEREFLPIERPGMAPLVFLQSLSQAGLVFITLPVHVVDGAYKLEMSPEDLESLGMGPDHQPKPGTDVLCLAVITLSGEAATANLLAPIVINLKTNKALQAIQVDSSYSHELPLSALNTEEEC